MFINKNRKKNSFFRDKKEQTYRDWNIMIDIAGVQFSLESKDCVCLVDKTTEEDIVLGDVKDRLAVAMFFDMSILERQKKRKISFNTDSHTKTVLLPKVKKF